MRVAAPLRVGLVTGEFPPMPGGVGDYTRELAQALTGHDLQIHVITDVRCKPQETEPPPATRHLHPVIRHWSVASLLHIRRLARSIKLDLVNLQYQAAAYGLSAPIHFLPRLASVPTIVTFHDLRVPYLFPRAGRLRAAAVTHLARAAAGVIVTDPADELELRRRGGVARLTQILIGSNIAPAPPPDYVRAAWRARFGVAPHDFLLGYFGFLSESKGGDTLIGALAVLVERKARVKLVVIGGRAGPSDAGRSVAFAREIERRISRHDLADRIVRTGYVSASEVSAHLLACDAVVLPYRDGVSLRRGSLMAALVHGCAIITTLPAMPLPELRDGENIRLVPPSAAPAIVLAVSELLDAPELRARLGQGARELSRLFSWDGIAARTLAFYRSV